MKYEAGFLVEFICHQFGKYFQKYERKVDTK